MGSSYSDCVASLRTSLSFLESSVNTLGNGVEDFPRLSSVLKTVRVRIVPPSHRARKLFTTRQLTRFANDSTTSSFPNQLWLRLRLPYATKSVPL